MDKESIYNFEFEDANGKKIECELLFSFYLKKEDKNYLIFTDNSLNENNNYNVYIYYNTSNNDDLIPVTDEQEFEKVSKIYKHLEEKINQGE